jgi:hypothetical protein
MAMKKFLIAFIFGLGMLLTASAQAQQALIQVTNSTNYSLDAYKWDGSEWAPLGGVSHVLPGSYTEEHVAPGTYTIMVTVHSTNTGDMTQKQTFSLACYPDKGCETVNWNVEIRQH